MDNFLQRLKFTLTLRKPKWLVRKDDAEFESFFKILKYVLTIHGFCDCDQQPTTFREKFHSIRRKILSFLGRLVLILSMVFYIIWLILNRDDLLGMARVLPSISNNTFVATRYFILLRNRKKVLKIFEALAETYEELDVKHTKAARKQLKITKILQSFGLSLLIFTQLSQIVDFISNYIQHGTEVFTVQIWLPFDHKTNLNYFMSCSWICVMGLFCSSALYIGDWMIYSVTTVASVEFKVIGLKFKEILSDPNVKLRNLEVILKHHNQVINVCNELEIIVSRTLLHNCLQGTIIICLICFQIVILEDRMQLIVYGLVLVIVLSQIFLMSYHGQMLIDSSTSIGDAIYEADWESIEDVKVRKSLPFLLEICQIPKCLTACKFAVVSVPLFTSIFNTGYSYFSLLKQLYDDGKNEGI